MPFPERSTQSDEKEPTRCWVYFQRFDPVTRISGNVLTAIYENGHFWLRGEATELKQAVEGMLSVQSGQTMSLGEAKEQLSKLASMFRGASLSVTEINYE